MSIDQAGERFVEITTPNASKTKQTIFTIDYQISQFSLGKATYKGAKQYVQVTLGNLLDKFDKEKVTKDEIKIRLNS